MTVALARNSYGEERVRLLKVTRDSHRHDLKDLTVGIRFEGDFDDAHTSGDNSRLLPMDTMKNTVYALAKQQPIDQIEEFGIALVEHFFNDNRHLAKVRIDIAERRWERLPVAGHSHDHSFIRGSDETRTSIVTGVRDGVMLESGISELAILKTTGAGFEGFMSDEFTTLSGTSERMLATTLAASWRYDGREMQFRLCWEGVRQTLLEVFAEHESLSVQHSLYAMGETVLDRFREISEIKLSMPNRHHLPIDLTPFGMENRNEIFAPIAEPYGLAEATLRRETM